MARNVKLALLIVGGLTLAAASGCAKQLMMTPNLYLHRDSNPFADVPIEHQSNIAEVIYATDRLPLEGDQSGGVQYGFHRSPSLAFGTARIQIGENIAWDELVAASVTQRREVSLPLSLKETTELGRFPAYLETVTVSNGKPVASQPGMDREREAQQQLHDLLSARLANTPRKDVLIFIHGFNNQFYESAFVIAELWHFLGRQGVPIFYSWPAGIGGPTGYAYDRESGEFTIWHLKQFLRNVAAHPEVRKIHIVAHSRGTDVATSALRELHIEMGRVPEVTRERLKIGHFVLAAADLDLQVAGQRIANEDLLFVPGRMTLYLSKQDRALGFALWLFESLIRLGQLTKDRLNDAQRHALAQMPQLSLIEAKVATDWLGHSYFYANPAVSSDLILLLRDGCPPGECGRDLRRLGDNFWEVHDGYCQPPK